VNLFLNLYLDLLEFEIKEQEQEMTIFLLQKLIVDTCPWHILKFSFMLTKALLTLKFLIAYYYEVLSTAMGNAADWLQVHHWTTKTERI
jgi:hypothetical protein